MPPWLQAETAMSTQALTRNHQQAAPRLREAIVQLIAGLRRDLAGGYRPERHYMRGPGPRWYAKHARAEAAFAPGHAFA